MEEEFTLSTGEKIGVVREVSADTETLTFTVILTTNHVVDPDDIMDNNRFAKTYVVPNN